MNKDRSILLSGIIPIFSFAIVLFTIFHSTGAEMTIVVNGKQTKQRVYGVGVTLSPWQLRSEFRPVWRDDIKLRSYRYRMFSRNELMGSEFMYRDNDDVNVFNWDYYKYMFSREAAVASQRGIPNWFEGLKWLTENSKRVLVSSWIYWQAGHEMPHLLHMDEKTRNAQIAEDFAATFIYARDNYGVNLSKIFFSINEPDYVGFGGLRLKPIKHYHLLEAIAKKFSAEGFENIKFGPPDTSTGKHLKRYLSPIMRDSFLRDFIAAGSYHIYGKAGNAVSWANSQGLDAWMTEYRIEKNNIDSNLFQELSNGASLYFAWDPTDAMGHAGERWFGYYTLKHFNRYFDYPSKRIKVTSSHSAIKTFAALKSNGHVSIVLGNTGPKITARINFMNIESLNEVYGFQSSQGSWSEYLGTLPLNAGQVVLTLPARSLTTLTNVLPVGREHPIAVIDAPVDGTTVNVGDKIIFDASGSMDSDGSIVSYEWNFGDATIQSGSVVSHAFSDHGVYCVRLEVENDAGKTGYALAKVVVQNPGKAKPVFTFTSPTSDVKITDSLTVTWTDDDPDSDARILWYFDTDSTGYDGKRVVSLFHDDFEDGNLDGWTPRDAGISWSIVTDPSDKSNKVARNDVAKSNSYLVLNQSFPEAVMISARMYGSSSSSPAVRFSHKLEAPASYRGGGSVRKRPGNTTLHKKTYPHSDIQWYYREVNAVDRMYGDVKGVKITAQVYNDSSRQRLVNVVYHDNGIFSLFPLTLDRGANGIAIYSFSNDSYFDDVYLDPVSMISEDDETDSFTWDLSYIPRGSYYLYVIVTDGYTTVKKYLPYKITKPTT